MVNGWGGKDEYVVRGWRMGEGEVLRGMRGWGMVKC